MTYLDKIGYIYIRWNESYDKYDAYKLGSSSNIPERNSQYITNEIEKGEFRLVIEIFNKNIKSIDIVEEQW